MATRVLLRTLLSSSNQTLITRSFTGSAYLLRFRPAFAVAAANFRQSSLPATNACAFSTSLTTSSLNDSNPNWSNRPPKETILLDGCDFEHWLVVVEKPEGDPTRDEIIDSYIKLLSQIVGSYEEARMKLYSVSTRCYYAFGALVSEEDSYKIKELPGVRWVLPDSYLDVKNKDYGGEPVIDGVPVPYDPKYHEEWIRNNSRANERNRRNDRPRSFDRSKNFERRRENLQNNNRGPPNMGSSPHGPPPPNNMRGGPPPHMGGPPPHMGGPPAQQSYMGGSPNMSGPQPHMSGPQPHMSGPQPHMGGPPNMGGGPPPPHMNGPSPNMRGPPPNIGGPPNMGGPPPSNMGGLPPNNMGGLPPNNMGGYGGPPPHSNNWNGPPPPPTYGGGPPNMGGIRPPSPPPNYQQQGWNGQNNGYQSGQGQNSNYGGTNSYGGGNPYQNQNQNQSKDIPGRDMPPVAANYE